MICVMLDRVILRSSTRRGQARFWHIIREQHFFDLEEDRVSRRFAELNRGQEGKFACKVAADTDPGFEGKAAIALDLVNTDLPVSAMADLARALDAKQEEWEELAAASPNDDFPQAKAKFHTAFLDDVSPRSRLTSTFPTRPPATRNCSSP